jgi:hypothetical protein
MNTFAQPTVLRARTASEVLRATDPWMFAPGGVHTITCGYGAGAANVTLRIDESTVAVLNAALAKLNATHQPQRAFIDKEHDAQAGATAWPQRFEWRQEPQPGVYVIVEPSALGQQLVNGKVMRAFSPSFLSDAELPKSPRAGSVAMIAAGKRGSPENPARMIGLDYPAVGTLTNDPAFRKILPLWAKNAGANASGSTNHQHPKNSSMKLTPEQKAALQARKTELEQSLPTLRASAAQNPTDAASAEAVSNGESELEGIDNKLALHAMVERTEELENALRAQREKDADAAVADAVRRGAIAAKDTALQATWKEKCLNDPSAIVLLASMRGSPALGNPTPRLVLGQGGIVITREDSVTVLKAYAAERNPRKKAAIYARDLSKRIKDGEDLPLHATNTLGTLAGELIVQRSLELLLVEQPLLGLIATDFSEQPLYNREVNSRIVSIPGTTAYNTSTGYADENTVTTDVPVVIDQHYSSQVTFNVEELASTSRSLFGEQAPAQAYAMAKRIIDHALSKITTTNFTNTPTTKALIDFGRRTVIAMGGALSDRGVPMRGRYLMLTGTYYDELFSDSTVVNLAANQQSQIITGARLPMLHDFMVVRTPTLPSTGNLTGFAGSQSALVVASRAPSDYTQAFPGVDAGGRVQSITDPQSGITAQLVQFIDHKLGTATQRVAFMFGSAKGQDNAGQILRSATP